jgi:chromosomal replication initiator protein
MDLNALWGRLLGSLAPTIGPQNIEIWLRTAKATELRLNEVVLEVPNAYYSDWIGEHYQHDIERELSRSLARPMTISYRFADQDKPPAVEPNAVGAPPWQDTAPRGLGLNTAQTFDSFVVGECNKFAHAAAGAVADFPATDYNPLFIYGSTGLGKTHLMHAIGNAIVHRTRDARIVYVTAEDFMNEMIKGLRYKRMEQFRNKYRSSATVLLVDDIQFLSGKERTQEEFFHTFNSLQTSGRQIVLTSDVEPKNIQKLEPRLRTRFEGGLLADMQAPDKETLLAILWQKADDSMLTIPKDVADAIANRVAGNIRELEGILKRLAALHTFYREPVSMEFARKQMPSVFTAAAPTVTTSFIIESVAKFHSIRSADIIGKKRTRTLTDPRHIAMYLARKHTGLSFPELGREFGNRDHSTVQHGCRKVERGLKDNADLAYKIRLIEQGLNVRSG